MRPSRQSQLPQILQVLVIDGLMCPQVEHVHLVMRLMILVMAVGSILLAVVPSCPAKGG